MAGAAVAKAEIGAHPHFTHVQALHQQAPHELAGLQRGHARVEAQHADGVDAERRERLQLHARQLQARRRHLAGEELARQRLETHGHGRDAQGLGARDGVAHQRAMAHVQAIEGTDAGHAAIRAQRPAVEVAEQSCHSGSGTRPNGQAP